MMRTSKHLLSPFQDSPLSGGTALLFLGTVYINFHIYTHITYHKLLLRVAVKMFGGKTGQLSKTLVSSDLLSTTVKSHQQKTHPKDYRSWPPHRTVHDMFTAVTVVKLIWIYGNLVQEFHHPYIASIRPNGRIYVSPSPRLPRNSRGFAVLNYHLGFLVMWGRYNLMRSMELGYLPPHLKKTSTVDNLFLLV